MIRKSIIALTAVVALGAASLTPASAHHMHGWGWGGVGLGVGLGLLGASIAASTGPAYVVTDDSCLQYQYMQTPHGYLKRVLVNVCQ
jgi:hypothetical protein